MARWWSWQHHAKAFSLRTPPHTSQGHRPVAGTFDSGRIAENQREYAMLCQIFGYPAIGDGQWTQLATGVATVGNLRPGRSSTCTSASSGGLCRDFMAHSWKVRRTSGGWAVQNRRQNSNLTLQPSRTTACEAVAATARERHEGNKTGGSVEAHPRSRILCKFPPLRSRNGKIFLKNCDWPLLLCALFFFKFKRISPDFSTMQSQMLVPVLSFGSARSRCLPARAIERVATVTIRVLGFMPLSRVAKCGTFLEAWSFFIKWKATICRRAHSR